MPAPTDLAAALRAMATAMVTTSGGRLRLASHEADDTTDHARTDEFLKFDGQRLGRDLALYVRMAGMTGMGGREATLADIAVEILRPIRDEVPASFQIGLDKMVELARTEFKQPGLFEAWEELLADQPAVPAPH